MLKILFPSGSVNEVSPVAELLSIKTDNKKETPFPGTTNEPVRNLSLPRVCVISETEKDSEVDVVLVLVVVLSSFLAHDPMSRDVNSSTSAV